MLHVMDATSPRLASDNPSVDSAFSGGVDSRRATTLDVLLEEEEDIAFGQNNNSNDMTTNTTDGIKDAIDATHNFIMNDGTKDKEASSYVKTLVNCTMPQSSPKSCTITLPSGEMYTEL